MVGRFSESSEVSKRKQVKHVHEGGYVAEVEVELIEDGNGWAPYLSVDDACKLDDIREALRRGDLKLASSMAKVYELRPVASR
jgi:hypothetical protein